MKVSSFPDDLLERIESPLFLGLRLMSLPPREKIVRFYPFPPLKFFPHEAGLLSYPFRVLPEETVPGDGFSSL